jgi:acyl-CoA thioesterase FadM
MRFVTQLGFGRTKLKNCCGIAFMVTKVTCLYSQELHIGDLVVITPDIKLVSKTRIVITLTVVKKISLSSFTSEEISSSVVTYEMALVHLERKRACAIPQFISDAINDFVTRFSARSS